MRDMIDVCKEHAAVGRGRKSLAALALGALLALCPAARAFGDTTPPMTTLSMTGGYSFSRFGQTYATPDARYVLSASDAESGVAEVRYSIDGGLLQAYSQPFTLADGLHTISYSAADNAGNAGPAKTAAFNVSPFENNALSGGGTGEDSVGGSIISSGTLIFNGPFTANGGSAIYGDVIAPSITISNNSTLYGAQIIASNALTPAPFDLSLALASATASNNNAAISAYLSNGVLTAGSGSITLPAGNYVLQGIDLNGSIVDVAGKVGLYVRGAIRMSGGARLNAGAGADTENLVIFSDSDQDISFTGGAVLGAYLYAPRAALSVTGGFRGGGHIFIDTCKVNGNGPSVFASGRVVPGSPGVPPSPSDLSGAAQSASSILWTWVNNDTTADGYRVMSGAANLSGDLPLGASSWIQTGLSPNASSGPLYVQAFNASGTSDSNLAWRYTLAAVPAGLSASAASTTIAVSWSAEGNPAGTVYELERSVSGGAFAFSSSGTALGALDAGLTPLTSYAYEVRALNAEGVYTVFAPAVSTTTPAPGAPAGGAGLGFSAAALSPTSIRWSWNDAALNQDGYRVMSGGVNLSGDLPRGAVSWVQTGLSPNALYGPYVVQAFNAGGTGDSNAAWRYTLAAVPAGLAVTTLSTGTISVTWSSNGNSTATAYNLVSSTMGGTYSTIKDCLETVYLNGGLSPSTTYLYMVRAVNAEGVYTEFTEAISAASLPAPTAAFSTLDSLRVYPNPFKPNGGDPDQGKPFVPGDPTSGIIFDRLTSSVKVRIYTITGALVTELDSDNASGMLQWDVKTGGGHDLASGQYIAVLTSPGQKEAVRKILIIR